jgi:pimeloyl-ACP methyl ester carboxylesterase
MQGGNNMTVPKTQLIEINGAPLEIRVRGAGEPVLFVHGSMGDECATVVKEPILADRYQVIDYHRRGYGRSGCPERPVSIAQQVADCKAVLDHLGVEKAHCVGQSYGGVILLQTALDHPDTVQSLALLEPALPSVLFSAPAFQAVGEKAGGLYASGDKTGAMDAFGREVGGADFRADFDRTLPPGYFERWVAESDTVFKSDIPALPAWQFTREDAARITQPVLNARGANTRAYFRDVYALIREWLPQAENFVVPDATHAMLQTNPPAIAERLARFFADHRM